MGDITWEKSAEVAELLGKKRFSTQRKVYGFGFIALILAIVYLAFNGFGGSEYTTVNELMAEKDEMIGKDVRVNGAVSKAEFDGEIMDYHFDQKTQTLTFMIVHIPKDDDEIRKAGGLGQVVYEAANDPDAERVKVVYHNAEVPDLLKHEAHAIIEGHLEFEDGEYILYAEKLMLKCPTRYSDQPQAKPEDSNTDSNTQSENTNVQ